MNKVLVDTSVWSLALRRPDAREPTEHVRVLSRIITDHRAVLIGPVRQEILSGMRNSNQFTELKERLRAFPDLPIQTEEYETAAEYFNVCRGRGVQGSQTDFLICAVARAHGMPIFTTDNDFRTFAEVIEIELLDF